jgi:hypothetical protein
MRIKGGKKDVLRSIQYFLWCPLDWKAAGFARILRNVSK